MLQDLAGPLRPDVVDEARGMKSYWLLDQGGGSMGKKRVTLPPIVVKFGSSGGFLLWIVLDGWQALAADIRSVNVSVTNLDQPCEQQPTQYMRVLLCLAAIVAGTRPPP